MLALKLQKKFTGLSNEEILSLTDQFNKLDVDGKGYLDQTTTIKAFEDLKKGSYDEVREAIREVDIDSSGRVEAEDFVGIYDALKKGVEGTEVRKGRITIKGSSSSVSHTINEEERREFIKHVNSVLVGDPDLGERIPINTETFEFFDQCKDGLILSKLINDSVPDTIDERVLNKSKNKKPLDNFKSIENNNVVINSAKAMGGISITNIGAGDLLEGREHLILGLVWQIIRRGLLGKIDITLHPELYRLLEEDETLDQFLRLPPEKILLRWFNFHLNAANWHRRVSNFSKDVSDGENYTILLNQLAPDLCSRAPLQTQNVLQRAEQVLENSEKLNCRKYLSATAMVAGNPKLNLAFVAHLFNTHPGLEPLNEEEKPEIEPFDAEGEREARVFTLWLNSLDVVPSIHDFFNNLRDGCILLQAYDKITPSTVNWKRVNKPPASGDEMLRFKAVENCNYAVDLGKQQGFSLVGIQGADINDGSRTLTLALVWQMMRMNITKTLHSLSRGGKTLSDNDMVAWANSMAAKGGRGSHIRSFRDPSLSNGIFVLDVLHGIKSEYVDYSLVTDGSTEELAIQNARLAISIARKLGAVIFILPEDIVSVRPRLILHFIGSLMAV
ncbi:fimbrin [Schizosaccharomyces cryophilus OY26]|uniref:Fimbrin n=1 Tax=Schizosaccharomyces cryophilus (strain OY26 / ATCC MYA-4695 / CBS 11777 / NBRC 106824 / NRRL Y48691) TaxID=653667 RepID=S9W899_SCHCR|nr:fimbrin [Schizosaccharomyces cryophilus OY26]EPY53995.1 fimbrin [Schizosaccharomyces cryophilus OY26]